MTQLKLINNSCRTVKTTILGNGGTEVKKYSFTNVSFVLLSFIHRYINGCRHLIL